MSRKEIEKFEHAYHYWLIEKISSLEASLLDVTRKSCAKVDELTDEIAKLKASKSEANEAVEFAEWKDKLHPSKNKECYTSNFPGHYFLKTNSELYETFKTRNNK